jgi:hypothetical protein
MSVKHAGPVALAAVVLAAVAAGCGSGQPRTVAEPPAKPPTRAEWAQQANTICRRENDELAALSENVGAQVGELGFEAFARQVLATQERAHIALGDVPVPADDRAAVMELLDLQAQANEDAAGAIEALVAGREKEGMELLASADRSAARSVEMAVDLGADTCAEGFDDVSREDGSTHLLADDFSDPSSSMWSTNEDRGTSIRLNREADSFSINARDRAASAAAMLPETVNRLAVAADVRQVSSAHAPEVAIVSCIAGSGEGVSYDFGVAPDVGYYAISKVTTRGVRVLKQGDRPGMVRGLKKVNHVRGECSSTGRGRATTVRLFVNGERVLSVRDRKGFRSFVGVGLIVYSKAGGTTVEFDNVVADAL